MIKLRMNDETNVLFGLNGDWRLKRADINRCKIQVEKYRSRRYASEMKAKKDSNLRRLNNKMLKEVQVVMKKK